MPDTYTAEEYVRALLAAQGASGEKDVLYRPFRLAMLAAAEAGDKINPDFQQELMRSSLEKFVTPPLFLNHDLFTHIVTAWGEKIAPQLYEILRDERADSRARGVVAEALGAMRATAAVPDMLALLRDERVDKEVRGPVAKALGEMRATAAVLDMLALLRDERVDVSVRWAVAEALGEMRATAAVLEMCEILRDERVYVSVRWAVAKALDAMNAPGAMPRVMRAFLRDKRVGSWVCWEAAELLGEITAAVPDMLALLRDEQVDSGGCVGQ